MQSDYVPEGLLRAVTPATLAHYADRLGWTRKDARNFTVYTDPADASTEIIVPLRHEFADYSQRALEAIRAIAGWENRSEYLVALALAEPPSDVLQFAVEANTVRDGSVPLDYGITMIQATRKSLLASAAAVVSPEKYYPRLGRRNVVSFVEACRLGQTEIGSYVTTFVCPLAYRLAPAEESDELFGLSTSESFTRKVVERLLRGVELLTRTIDDQDTDRILRPQTREDIVSSNLCEALAAMRPPGEGRMRIEAALGGLEMGHPSVSLVLQVEDRHFAAFAELARELRPEEEPLQNVFVGKVEVLKRQPDSEEPVEGEITLLFQDDEAVVRAKLRLQPSDYETAIEAHKNDRYVSVRGTLIRGQRLNTIEDPRAFGLVSLPGM